MKIVVDWPECEANAICMGIAPEIFDVDDEDNLHVLIEEPGPELETKAREAVKMCPKRALSIQD